MLVWDGRDGGREVRARRLTVLFTAAGPSADDRLLELCRGPFASHSATTWVVSSDADVRRPAIALGFTTLGAMEFYRRWTAPAGEGRAPRGKDPGECEGRHARASRTEIDELLEAFLSADRDRG